MPTTYSHAHACTHMHTHECSLRFISKHEQHLSESPGSPSGTRHVRRPLDGAPGARQAGSPARACTAGHATAPPSTAPRPQAARRGEPPTLRMLWPRGPHGDWAEQRGRGHWLQAHRRPDARPQRTLGKAPPDESKEGEGEGFKVTRALGSKIQETNREKPDREPTSQGRARPDPSAPEVSTPEARTCRGRKKSGPHGRGVQSDNSSLNVFWFRRSRASQKLEPINDKNERP